MAASEEPPPAEAGEEQEETEEEEVEVYEEVEEEVEEQEEQPAEEEQQQQSKEEPKPELESNSDKAVDVAQHEASASSEPASTSGGGAVPLPVAELERQAKEAIDKISSGLKSALGQFAGADASTSLSKLAGGLTAGLSTAGLGSWFGGETSTARKKAAMTLQTSKASNELVTLFGLDDTEALVESFRCKLLQTYACNHNSYTPAIQMAFQGSLYVTDRHVCFSVEERGRQLPIKIPLKDITKASRQLPAQKGPNQSDLLRLDLTPLTSGPSSGQPRHVAFKDFEVPAPGSGEGAEGGGTLSGVTSSGGALDSALALIEHLTEDEQH